MSSRAKKGKLRKTHKFLSCLKLFQKTHASKVSPKGNAIIPRRSFKFLTSAFISFAFTIAFSGITLWTSSPAIAAPVLTITPISWNVVGLDSNNVNVGPNTYMSGARVCNIGDTPATNVKATFIRDGAINPYITLQGSNTLSVPSLPAGSSPPSQYTIQKTPTNCTDFYYNVVVTRNSAAYDTKQSYHIEATADNLGVVSTPTPRELYVEHLISQNRNAINSISGPTSVTVGQTYQYTVVGKTATQGYEQLTFSPDFPNTLFQVLGASTTYSAPAGGVNSTIYADACGWENNPTSTYYHNNLTCDNTAIQDNYSGAKAGGAPISTTYTVKVLSAGSATISNVLYDFSGSSYHYNSDYGSGTNLLTITAQNPATGIDLEMSKTHSGDFTVNTNAQYNLTVKNVGQLGTNAQITVTDALPTQLTYVSATGTGWTCLYNSTNRTVTCTSNAVITLGQSSTITLTVTPTTTGNFNNSATVTTLGDTNTGNNTASDPTVVNALADISVTKNDGLTTINPGGAITYTIVVTNKATSPNLTSITVDDVVPSQITGVTWTCSTPSGGNSCAAATGSGNNISTTVTLKSGVAATFSVKGSVDLKATGTLSNTATVGVPAAFTDTTPADNNATDTTNVLAPDLTIAKTHTGKFQLNQNDSFTLTVRNVGFASTTGTTTVTDTLPAGLTYVSAAGTGWACSASAQTVTCTNPNAIAPNTPSTITLTVTRTSGEAIVNTVTVSNTSDNNGTNNSATDTVPAVSRLRLVKRITAIIPTNSTNTTVFVDDSGTIDDNASNWPSGYLQGAINGGNIKPGEQVEYTIYFLSDGGFDAANSRICDLVPANTTFVPDAFVAGKGIKYSLGSTTTDLTNTNDTDQGRFYTSTEPLPPACRVGSNVNGTVLANVSGAIVVDLGTIAKAIGPGNPSNSYGFIRFRARVN